MKSFKKTATNFLILFCSYVTLSCQSHPKTQDQSPLEILAQSVKGSISLSTYTTHSDVVVYDKKKVSKKYTNSVEFKIDRRTINVNENGDIQFRTVTTDKKGNIELKDLAYPEPGQELYEMIDKHGKQLVVKDMPIGSIYYVSRVALPKNPVKVGDTWLYNARWISEATGWPFEITLNSKLKAWSDCDGLMCAIITFEGAVSLPEDFPLKATLSSKIKGEYYYSPVSHEVLWGESVSDEEFFIEPIDKKIKVKSRSCSYRDDYIKKC